MKSKNPFLVLIALAMTAQMLHAEIIASFIKDFRPGTPAEGWSYCRNPGELTDPTSWLPLVWNQSLEMYTVNASTYPDRKGQAYLMIRNGSVRPGKGSDSGETSKTEGAAIAVYTLKEGEQGTIKLTSASVARSGTVEGTVRLSVLVNSEIKKEIVVHSSEKQRALSLTPIWARSMWEIKSPWRSDRMAMARAIRSELISPSIVSDHGPGGGLLGFSRDYSKHHDRD